MCALPEKIKKNTMTENILRKDHKLSFLNIILNWGEGVGEGGGY